MKAFKRVTLVLVMALCVTVLTACGSSKGLVGKWTYGTGNYTYTFNEDKTGSYDAYGTELKFTYTNTDDEVTISYEGTTSDNTYKYRIEGDKLIIKDDLGNDVEYNRK